jgi:hypothetical protein
MGFLRSIFALLALLQAVEAKHFQEWYEVYGGRYRAMIRNECNSAYTDYMTRTPRPNCKECLAEAVVECILKALPEDAKANIAASGVLLGLLPSILSQVGLKTVEMGLLFQRRPLLSFLMMAGAPAVFPARTQDYHSGPVAMLKEVPGRLELPSWLEVLQIPILLLEYAIVAGAVVNVLLVTIELSRKTVCTFTPTTEYLPLVWALAGIAVHMVGILAFRLRARLRLRQQRALGPFEEWRICRYQKEATLTLREQSWAFIFMSWLTSTGYIIHIIIGTLIFSTTLFISADTALKVAARYLGSTLACRIVLMFEMAGMAARTGLNPNGHERA